MNTERLYRVLGTTEDAPTAGCQHCGRQDLRTYVALEPTEGGPIVYFGTTCAARAERLPVATIRTEARQADQATAEAARLARQEAAADQAAAYSDWLEARYGVRQPADLWDADTDGLSPFQVSKLYHAEKAAA